MDGADIFWHDAFKCQLSEICFSVSLCVHTEVIRAFIKRSCTFVHFRPSVRFFTVLFDQILFQRGCQVQFCMLFLNIEFKLTTLEILNLKVLSTKICLQSHLGLIFCCTMIFQNLRLSRVAQAKTCI